MEESGISKKIKKSFLWLIRRDRILNTKIITESTPNPTHKRNAT